MTAWWRLVFLPVREVYWGHGASCIHSTANVWLMNNTHKQTTTVFLDMDYVFTSKCAGSCLGNTEQLSPHRRSTSWPTVYTKSYLLTPKQLRLPAADFPIRHWRPLHLHLFRQHGRVSMEQNNKVLREVCCVTYSQASPHCEGAGLSQRKHGMDALCLYRL